MSKSGGIDPPVPPVPTALTWSHPFNEEFGIHHEAKNILCHILGHLLISNHHPTSSFLNFFDLGDPWFWLDFLVCFCLPNRLHKITQILVLQMFLFFSSGLHLLIRLPLKKLRNCENTQYSQNKWKIFSN